MSKKKRMLKLKEIEERSEAERQRRRGRRPKRGWRRSRRERLSLRREGGGREMKMVEEKALKFMFMDTSTLNAKAKAYVELCRDEMLMKKQILMRNMMG